MRTNKKLTILTAILCCLIAVTQIGAYGQAAMRRPISPNQPMYLIHIDTWNYADPQKVIDLIPADIRPYVVLNISLSISHDATTGAWTKVEYGYETAKSWLRTCAENQVWAMIQPAAGGPSQFSETDLTVYKEFYQNYPNFIGFNYAEQFWGFDDASDVRNVSWTGRIAHFVDLINLAYTYGGYLCVSWCGAYYSAGMNPIAMLKRNPAFASVLQSKSDHFILCEKFTSKYGFYDIESTCLGTYLSGYSGQYGIRFDQTGWSGGEDATGSTTATFPLPAGAAPVIEHIMFTGETVMDGPELIWQQCIQSLSNGTTADGYTTRKWGLFPQFNNISIDIFRKVLDGTIRIMTRKEVIDRTKLVIINDVSSGSDTAKYSSPMALFDGLYKTDGSGQLLNNRTWFKKTGRYPAIPTVYALNGTDANSFPIQVNKSAYNTRWTTTTAKVNEFNNLFDQEYTGTIYAGRNENGWVTYNPYKTATTATGNIPFKYNTCTSMDLSYSQYTAGVIKEYSDKVTFYLTNFDNTNTALQTDVIKINGCSSQPTFSSTDRASHSASSITSGYSSGVFTLTVTHNGPLDITVNCSGSATGRLTSYKTASIIAPSTPTVYTGPRQYEAENFDYKSIAGNVTEGYNTGIANYTALGYLQFGTNAAASIKKTVKVQNAGTYLLATKYSTAGGDINTIDLYVNGTKVATPTFTQTASTSTWGTSNQNIALNAGSNTIEFRANATGARTIYFDNIIIDNSSTVSVTGVSVSPTAVSINTGATSQLTATVSPSNATNKNVTWSSSNTAIATVSSSGLVTVVAGGTATITVTTVDGVKTAISAITVTSIISVTGVSVSPTTVSINAGATSQLTATVSPSNETNNNITWSSSNTAVATVSLTGLVTGVTAGSANITVTTVDGAKTATCVVTVTTGSTNVYLEAECGTVGSLFSVASSSTASNSTYATVKAGNNATSSAPADATGWITLPFTVSAAGTYSVWLRTICLDANGDSFWLKMDNGSFVRWNNIPLSTAWAWNKYGTTYSLTSGSHTLTMAYSEDGAQLDKIYITSTGDTPSSTGATAANLCAPVLKSASVFVDNGVIGIYPNPVSKILHVSLTGSPSTICLYNISGQQFLSMNTENTNVTIDMAKYVPGIYVMKITCSDQTVIEKIVKQ